MDAITTFCKNLEEKLRASGMKQKELANKAQCSEQTISAYVKTGLGKNNGKRPSFEMAILIADVFGASLDEMCGRESAPADVTYSTFGDVVREIDKIVKALCPEPDETSGVEVELYDDLGAATLRMYDLGIVNFYKARKRMDELLRDGIIEHDMYMSWLNGEMNKLYAMRIDNEEAE